MEERTLAPPKARRRFKNPAEGHAAASPTDAVFEDNVVRIDEVAQASAFGMRQDQPTALNDLVCPVLTPDFVASILIKDERRALAGRRPPLKLEPHALVIAIQALLGLRWCDRRDERQQERRES